MRSVGGMGTWELILKIMHDYTLCGLEENSAKKKKKKKDDNSIKHTHTSEENDDNE